MVKMEINPNKIYKMPKYLTIKFIDEKILVISQETANWLLLDNKNQLEMFNYLSKSNTIANLLKTFPAEYHKDIYHVLVELEAKKFENVTVKYPQNQGMYIYLTKKCNQKCKHCYMKAGIADADEMTTIEIKNILLDFVRYGGKVVTFTGGEATMRVDFIEIADYAKKIGLKVCVLSNGLLWTTEFVKKISKKIDEVQISIDGFDSKSYESIRGIDTFDVALEALDRILKAGIRTLVSITPLLETLLVNQTSYVKFAKFLTSKYKDKGLIVKFNTELLDGRNVSLTRSENLQYRTAIAKILLETSPFSKEENFAIDHMNNTIFNNCGYGGLCIDSNGDVYFCNIISKCSKQSNIRRESFDTIMRKSQKARLLSDINNLVPCNKCELKYICGGGCRIKHFNRLVEAPVDFDKTNVKIIRNTSCSNEDKANYYRLMR